jgi:uncharacterized integral membrane protein
VSTHDPLPQPTKTVDKKERTRRIAALVIGVLIVLLAVANLDDVKVHWIITTTKTPLIVVIAVSFVLGLGGGYLLRGRRAAAKVDKKR